MTQRPGFGMMTWLAIAAGALCLAASAHPCAGQELPALPDFPESPISPGKGKTGEQLVKVRAVADLERIKPGETFHLAFIFDIEPKWHIYWKNSGASGGPTEIDIEGPDGFAIGETLFPRPTIHKGEEGATYVYENQVVLFVPVTAPAPASVGAASFTAKVSWLVCKEICLMGRATTHITLPVGASDLPRPALPDHQDDPSKSVVREYKSRLPQPVTSVAGAETTLAGNLLTVIVPSQGKSTAEFFPIEMPGVTYGEATVKVEGSMLRITVPVTIKPNDSMGQRMMVQGVLGLGTSQTDPCYALEIALPAS